MEGGEWNNFNAAVCVHEEADFMAQLFRNPNEVEARYGHHETSNYHMANSNSSANGSSYYSSDSSSQHHQQTSYRNPHVVGYYHMDYMNDSTNNHYQQHHHNHALPRPPPTLPIDFLQCQAVEDEDGVNADHASGRDNLEEPPAAEDKNSDSSDNLKKRPRALDIPKGKRNVRAKKNRKLTLGGDDEEENEAPVNGQSTSSGSLEDDCSSKGNSTALNSSGKTRASRGSATDPQSLYARKRRERINERLRILQGLVPNGTKVDISTMLEEAVQYVKFLQLQIKLLSSDELWMYAPIAYNGMNIGLDFNLNLPR